MPYHRHEAGRYYNILFLNTPSLIIYHFTAIREDRTRGGRSTYQCSYTLPPGMAPALTTTTTPVTSTQQPISLPTLPLPPPSLTTKLDEEDEDEEEEEDEDGEIRQNENVPQLIRVGLLNYAF